MQIVVLGVVRPKITIDFDSKEVEPSLMRGGGGGGGVSMDSPCTVFWDC